jgi:hypothetical protein
MLDADFDVAPWADAAEAKLSHFWDRPDLIRRHPDGTEEPPHRPVTRVRMVYDRHRIYGLFSTEDQYVRSLQTGYQSRVYNDSCVEWFVEPVAGKGYFNFEFNAGGAMLLYYNVRTADGHHEHQPVVDTWMREIDVFHSLPCVVEPEIKVPVTWRIGFSVPYELLEAHVGCQVTRGHGATWRGNFNRCAPCTSHPHFATWAPIPNLHSFHSPHDFAPIHFGV